MSNNVKSFSVGYNPINKSNIFASGNQITGQITLELEKECKIDSLSVKLKGKAEVSWTENYGRTTVRYHAKDKYFSIKQFIIVEGRGKSSTYVIQFETTYYDLVYRGCHVYPFTFLIPAQDLPSSFKNSRGKIVYTLEAKLSRSMRIDSKAKAKFTLVHNGNLKSDPSLMTPQHSNTEKKMKLFTSGAVGMDVNINRTGFHQGEGIKVVASIHNKSSREIRPKYCLYRKYSYFAKGKRRVETKDILKEVGDAIPPSAGQTVTRIITIPPTTGMSILNCRVLKAEYRLRVYLDVKYASDPEIKFPIVVLPALQEPDGEDVPAYPTFGFEAFASSDMPGGASFLQNPTASGPSAPPPPYGTYGMYPSLMDFNGRSSK
ncbi:arrestin domain-containing protein 2-like [Morone saxatilis]|uniref:arrestin domain-containing protein 2-like n=1 Tax=Morone saxatilis TaxID=34816 RepID=UPI0015E1C87F|nr:arrestin domain-containing protein 2-like [Morone saxatilis]